MVASSHAVAAASLQNSQANSMKGRFLQARATNSATLHRRGDKTKKLTKWGKQNRRKLLWSAILSNSRRGKETRRIFNNRFFIELIMNRKQTKDGQERRWHTGHGNSSDRFPFFSFSTCPSKSLCTALMSSVQMITFILFSPFFYGLKWFRI